MKAVLINLRRYEVEKCLDLTYRGCGDGKLSARNDEKCDDGNLNSGDGCSDTCQVEFLYKCTDVQNEQSVCTPILCGNGKLDTGEECDDFDVAEAKVGCSQCKLDIGYKCVNTTCTKSCGDGQIYI